MQYVCDDCPLQGIIFRYNSHVTRNVGKNAMPKGGRRSTTWTLGWKTAVIRVPEALEEQLLEMARVLDEGKECHVTGNDGLVTDNRAIDEAALKESANTFFMTILPKERLKAKRLIYKFIDSIGTS